MRSRLNLPIYITYLGISLVVIGFIVAQMGLKAPWSHSYSVTATFTDAADILSNNEVFMNGSKVGHVGDVTVTGGQAQVQLVLDNPQSLPLHTDASAEVRKKNLLGETYIDLQRGTALAQMDDGGHIPVNHTVPITEIDQVLAIFDPQTVQRVQLLINALGNATTNNGQNMNSQASSANQLVTALNGPALELSVRQQQVQDIVLELQKFYGLLANQRAQVRDEFGTWNQVMGQLANQEGSISGTIQQADQLLQSLDALVTGRGTNIKNLLVDLPSALAQTNSFLDQTNTIINGIAPYRRAIGDVFPDLQTSFADTFTAADGSQQHFWSVFSVSCAAGPGGCSSANGPAASSGSPSNVWAAMTTSGGGS